MVRYIDEYREQFGVESICAVLPIAPSTYFRHKGEQADPTRRSTRARRDDELRVEIQRVWDDNHQVYGPRKVWKQLRREGIDVARCRVRRLMRDDGPGRRRARPRLGHDDPTRRRGGPAAGSRRPAIHRHRPQPALGVGLHVRRHLARVRLHRVRDRCLRSPDRRLAGVRVAAHRLRPRRARTSDLRSLRSRRRPR